MKEERFIKFLADIERNMPINAVQLRTAADSIISEWINLNFEYPHDLIDNLVYIESSIERIGFEYLEEPQLLAIKYKESFEFHINSFIISLSELRSYIEGCI